MTESKSKAELEADLANYRASIDKHQRKMRAAAQHIKDTEAALKVLELAPEPPSGMEVVRFTKKFGARREFHYAAISYGLHSPTCPHRRWSVTGKANMTGVPWSTVAEFIGEKETTRPKVTWLQSSMAQPFAELGFNIQARQRVNEAAAFAVRESGKPYVYGGM